ncbi:MAG: hypothetical protein IT338_20845 [Thermomicrobiales bacterium]|nr:hypothetical protein [Thermomicrobiales bacterium]
MRAYSLADIPSLARFRGTLRLDVPDSIVLRPPELIDLPAALPIVRRDRPMFVATLEGEPVGLIRFSPRRPDGRWVVSAVATSTGVYSPEPVWDALLHHGVRTAGLRGVRRLFARVPAGHPLIDAMRESGWIPYARETVFRAERLIPRARAPRALRLQEPADTWAIHQLYAASVPRQIQEIEALTSHVWHMDTPRRSRRGVRQTGYLLDEAGSLGGYARYTRGPRAGMIDAVVNPGDGERFGALLDGISAVPARNQPIYCALRAYLLDVREELTERGFVEIGEQELLIRYTTAAIRIPAADPVHFPVELRPALPRRVPTFLESQPKDGAV